MNLSHTKLSRPLLTLVITVVASISSAALAADKTVALDPKVRYQRESAACSSIRFFDDRANCLSEASTRYVSTQPTPPGEQPDVLKRNAFLRCDPLPDADRKDCVARIQGQGTTSGSVAGGGIYRELVTREVGVAPAPAPADPAASAAGSK